MTAPTTTPRPVSVEELKRAWHAVQAGDFRTVRTPRPSLGPSPRLDAPSLVAAWTPASGERVLPVVGSAGWCGATTLALALATAVGGPARVVECGSASATGLAAASTAELGADQHGWTHGSRNEALLDRAHTPRVHPHDVPAPSPAVGPIVSVVDVGHPVEQVLAGGSWLATLLTHAPVVVVAARVSVPGLRRLESCLALLDDADLPASGRTVVALLGPPRKRWPRDLTHTLGPLTTARLAAGRLVEVPEDRRLALRGLTPAPLPAPLISAAATVLHLTEGTLHA